MVEPPATRRPRALAGSRRRRSGLQHRRGVPVPTSDEPGTRLVHRYLLEEAPRELRRPAARGTTYWRAHDELLDRAVGLCLLQRDSPQRRSASCAPPAAPPPSRDPRFLRVLDANETDGVVYVVSEWVDGQQPRRPDRRTPADAPGTRATSRPRSPTRSTARTGQGLAHLCLHPGARPAHRSRPDQGRRPGRRRRGPRPHGGRPERRRRARHRGRGRHPLQRPDGALAGCGAVGRRRGSLRRRPGLQPAPGPRRRTRRSRRPRLRDPRHRATQLGPRRRAGAHPGRARAPPDVDGRAPAASRWSSR